MPGNKVDSVSFDQRKYQNNEVDEKSIQRSIDTNEASLAYRSL